MRSSSLTRDTTPSSKSVPASLPCRWAPATIGTGAWSAKDLLGHLAFWEELAAQALANWRAGQRPSAEDLFDQRRTDAANAGNDERSSGQSLDDEVAEVHGEALVRLQGSTPAQRLVAVREQPRHATLREKGVRALNDLGSFTAPTHLDTG